MTLFNDFSDYIKNIKNNDINNYFNCYSTYIMTRKDLKSNILNHRMNFLIKFYIETNNKNIISKNLVDYYLKNINDTYLTQNFNDDLYLLNKDDNRDLEKRDDDVELHYKNMFSIPIIPKKTLEEIEKEEKELDKIYLDKLYIEEKRKKDYLDDIEIINNERNFINDY